MKCALRSLESISFLKKQGGRTFRSPIPARMKRREAVPFVFLHLAFVNGLYLAERHAVC